MAALIKLKKSSTPGAVPDAVAMDYGELAINYKDGILYYKDDVNVIKQLASNATVAGAAGAVLLTGTQTITGAKTFSSLATSSTSLVTNLNAELLNSQTGSFYQNATNLTAGTVASARISGSYTGITGVSALTVGSIASGFGAIDITGYLLTAADVNITGRYLSASSATTGQPTFLHLSTSASDSLILKYTEVATGSTPIDVWQFRLGGNAARSVLWTNFDSTIPFWMDIANGRLGINSLSAPAYNLDVTGTGRFTSTLTLAAGTITASQPAIDITQTWNSSGITFTGLKQNITNNGSAVGSLLMDLQVGGSSKFRVDSAGSLKLNGTQNTFGTAIIDFSNSSGFATASQVSGISGETTNSGAGSIIGINVNAATSFAGTVASLTSVMGNVRTLNASTVVTNSRMFYALSPIVTAGGAITNQYGLYIESQKPAGVTAGYGVYQLGATDINYFAGNVGIGTTTPGEKLNISGGSIRFDGTNNYVYLQNGNSDSSPFLASVANVLATANYGWGFFDRGTEGNFQLQYRAGSTSWNPAITVLRTTGNVGIGTTAPNKLLTLVRADTGTSIGSGKLLRVLSANAVNAHSTIGFGWNSHATNADPVIIGYKITSTTGSGQGNFYIANRNGTTEIEPTEVFTILPDGNVGIGTTSASNKLHIQETGTGSFTGLRIGKSGDTAGDIAALVFQMSSNQTGEFGGKIGAIRQGASSRSDMFFSVTSDAGTLTERMRITKDGNVGIGTTAPRGRLDVSGENTEVYIGNTTAGQTAIITNTRRLNYGDVLFGKNLSGTASSDAYLTPHTTTSGGYAGVEMKLGGDIHFYSASGATTAAAAVTPTLRMSITASTGLVNIANVLSVTGNVGIGTAAPANVLHIVGTQRITATAGTTYGSIVFGDDTSANNGTRGISGNGAELQILPTLTSVRFMGTGGTNQIESSAADGSAVLNLTARTVHTSGNLLQIFNGGTGTGAKVVVDFAGNVGIGTAAPQTLLHVSGATANPFTIERTTTSSNINVQFKNATASWYAGQTALGTFGIGTIINLDSSLIFNITTGGNVGIGTTTPTGKLDIQGSAIHDLPTYSAEFLSTNTWTSTVTADWTGSFAAGWTHATGNTSVLSYTTAAVITTKYQIAYTVTGRTAGFFNIAFGGESIAGVSATGAWGPTTSSTAPLTITPTTDFNGTIAISIKSITGISTSLVNLKSSDGTARIEIRANNALGNTFIGIGAGKYNTTGNYNASNGSYSLLNNTTGYQNTANGYGSLYYNTTGYYNTAVGMYSLLYNTTGYTNTAVGTEALLNNLTGYSNTAVGRVSLYSNLTGYYNVAVGMDSLQANTTGYNNTAIGAISLYSNLTGYNNTSVGYSAGRTLTTGNSNTFLGYYAGFHGSQSLTASNSMALGNGTYTTADNQVVIGNTSVTQTLLNGSVGIGTTTPGDVLHISANGGVGFRLLDATVTTGGDTRITQLGQKLSINTYSNGHVFTGTPFVIDGTTQNVGIGTTSPTNILSLGNAAARKFWIENSATDVVGRALTVAAGGTVAGTSTSNVVGGNLILQSGLGTGTGASAIEFQTGTTLTTGLTLQTMSTKMTILGSGNVGIGTTSPVALLTVGSTTTTASSMTLQGQYQSSVFNSTNTFNFRHGEADRWRLATNQNSDASNDFDFKINSLNAAGTDHTTFVTIKGSNGNVGIGTTSPSYRLDVQGRNFFLGDSELTAGSRTNTTVKWGHIIVPHYTNAEEPVNLIGSYNDSTSNNIFIGGGLTASYNAASHISFFTAANSTTTIGTQRMRIVSSGKVMLGTASSPSYDLSFDNTIAKNIGIENSATDVVGRALTVAAGGTVTGTSTSDVVGGNLILQSGLGTGTGASTISFQTGTTLTTGLTLQTMSTKMTILGSGNVGIGTTTPLSLLTLEHGAVVVNSSGFRIRNTSGSGNSWVTDVGIPTVNESSYTIRDVTAGTYPFVIAQSSGNVGIGTAAPGAKLDVTNTTAGTNDVTHGMWIQRQTTGTAAVGLGTSLTFVLERGDGAVDHSSRIYSKWSNATTGVTQGDLVLSTASNGTFSDRLTILGVSGNVGIGTAAPAYTLDVTGTGRFTSTLLVTGAATLSSTLAVTGALTTTVGGGAGTGTQTMATRAYLGSRGMNLVVNGTAFLGNNYNFSGFTFDQTDTFTGKGSFRALHGTVGSGVVSDESISVDPDKTHLLTIYAKTTQFTSLSVLYAGIDSYDIDGIQIGALNVMRQTGTDTRLLVPLATNDMVVVVTTAPTSWYQAAWASDNLHLRAIILWGYKNSFGYTYPDYTYSRYWLTDMYMSSNSVSQLVLTNFGSGYTNGTYSLTFTPVNGGTGAAGSYVVLGGGVVSVYITADGSGYIAAPTVGFPSGGGINAAATAKITSNATTSTVEYLVKGVSGAGYTGTTQPLTFTGGGATTQATGHVTINSGGVDRVVLLTTGSGYTSNPTVTVGGTPTTVATVYATIGTGIDQTNKRIYLRNPFPAASGYLTSGTTWPIGSALSNGSSGGTYKYITVNGSTIPTSWTKYTGKIGGIDPNGQNAPNDGFRPGTAAVKILFLPNYNSIANCVISTTVSTAGSGYTSIPTLTFGSTPTAGSLTATGSAVMRVVSVTGFAAAGSGYAVGNIITVLTGTGTAATFQVTVVTSGAVTTLVALNTGGAYTVLPTLTAVATTANPAGGTGLTLNLSMGIGSVTILTTGSGYSSSTSKVLSATISSGGTGYAVNDILTVTGGTSTTVATFTVNTVSAGIVTAVTFQVAGVYTFSPHNPAATTGGTGSGCTLIVTWEGPVLTAYSLSGTGATFQVTRGNNAQNYSDISFTEVVDRNVATFQPLLTTEVGLNVKLLSGQTASMQEWQDSGGTALASIGTSGQFLAGNVGSAAFPGIAFQADTNTGMWRSAADTLQLVTNGVARVTIDSAGALSAGVSTFYASGASNQSTSTGTNWLRSPKNTVTAFIGDTDSTSAYTASEFSGNLRFNGLGVSWGDFGYYPTGGVSGTTNFGHFRFSLAGQAVATTPNAWVSAGVFIAATGFRVSNSVQTAANYLRSNGTDFVSAALAATDLTGTVAAARLPAFTGDVTSTVGTVALAISSSYTASLRAGYTLSGGGTITYNSSSYLLWSTRIIVISNGWGSHFSTSGFFDITCPTSGTITGVGGADNVTATSAGIFIGNWHALYYILPIGSGNASVAANFRIVSFSSALVIPEYWVLLAVQNNESSPDAYIKLFNAQSLKTGQSYNTTLGTTSATNLIAGTVATARLGSGTASATTFLRGDQTWAAPVGTVPVGTVLSWLKSFNGNTPQTLPTEFVECNGQALTTSPYTTSPYYSSNGTTPTIPNLNGANSGTPRFLRGALTSGGVGGSETHTHTVTSSISVSGSGTGANPVISVTSPTGSTITLPSYYEVVWIMRVM